MTALLVLANSLTLSALLLTAQAQAPASATSQDNPTPAKPTTKGATGTKGNKTVGQKMVEKSKPTDMNMPLPVPVRKLKQQ
jgi:hypothetical protein